MKRTASIIAGIAVLAFGCAQTVFAHGPDAVVKIVGPRDGETVVNSNVQITGTAPANELVQIVITDTDTNEPAITHQQDAVIEGSVTSDANGDWVYVPSQSLVPGQFSVVASHTNTDASATVHNSDTVKFIVVDETGSRGWLSDLIERRIYIAAAFVILTIVLVVVWLVRRHRRKLRIGLNDIPRVVEKTVAPTQDTDELSTEQAFDYGDTSLFAQTSEGRAFRRREEEKLNVLDAEAVKIEENLAKAAEQLEATNQEVARFREDILESRGVKPKTVKQKGTKGNARMTD